MVNLLGGSVRHKVDSVLLNFDFDFYIKGINLIVFKEANENELLIIGLRYHTVLKSVTLERIKSRGYFVEESLSKVLFLALIKRPCILHLTLTEQTRLILLHNVQKVALYFEQTCPQIAFQHKLNSLKLHFMNVEEESIICIAYKV